MFFNHFGRKICRINNGNVNVRTFVTAERFKGTFVENWSMYKNNINNLLSPVD